MAKAALTTYRQAWMVTDKAYADRGDYAFGTYRYFPGRPRTLFLELAYAQRHAAP